MADSHHRAQKSLMCWSSGVVETVAIAALPVTAVRREHIKPLGKLAGDREHTGQRRCGERSAGGTGEREQILDVDEVAALY